jgi:hypothetical protein
VKLAVGVLLLLVSGALTWAAWFFYEAGLPGAPRHPDPTSSNSPNIWIATASDLEVTASILYFEANLPEDEDSDFDADKLEQIVSVQLNAPAGRSFVVVIQLSGDARLAPGFKADATSQRNGDTVMEPNAPIVPNPDMGETQRFLFKITRGQEGDGRMRVTLSGKLCATPSRLRTRGLEGVSRGLIMV